MNGVALVTGAASGIGEATVVKLAASGWAVVAVDIDPDGLAALVRQVSEVRAYVSDVSDEGAVDGLAAAVGPVDRVVHAAAIARLGRALEQPREDAEQIWRVNFVGTVNVVRAFLPAMVERGRGELVLYSSLDGWVPARKMSAYAASKAAVNAYAEALAAECRSSGVKIRCVCPGRVDTPLYRSLAAEDPAAVAHHRGTARYASIMPTSVVVDAVERSLAGGGLFVYPGYEAKAGIMLRRHFPRLLGRILDYDTSPARSNPRLSSNEPTRKA
jgi:NAD(P)-dependent dehydrogenase (short-subunit alcohol dehydrogenase family)